MLRIRTLLHTTATVAVTIGALTLTACGSSSPTGESTTESAGSGAAGLADATAAVDAGIKGNYGALPTAGPKASPGKKVWIISAFQQVHNLAVLTEEAKAAGEKLGWQMNVCDGQNNGNGAWAGCVRQAIAAKAEAVILESVDCAPVKQALVEARKAGVKTVALTAFDCDDPNQGGGQPLFDATVKYTDSVPDPASFFRQQGKLRADWIIAQTEGRAKVLHVAFRGVALGEYLNEGFNEAIAKCTGCSVVGTVDIAPPDVPLVRQKFESALVKVPQANAVAVDVDFIIAAGVQQALVSANRPDLKVAGGECSQDSLAFIGQGKGVQMCIGAPLGWIAYGAIDALNRLFEDAPQVNSGVGWQVVTKEHNLPSPGTEFEATIDYRATFEKLWMS
jgi:ribose transport system substrate-binding protein